MFTCTVYYYDKMHYAPENYNICVCCGTEFGNDDCRKNQTPKEAQNHLRDVWIAESYPWFYGTPPEGWSGYEQIKKGLK